MPSDPNIPARVHLRIPVFDEFAWPCLVFSKWLPDVAGRGWTLRKDTLRATLYFDEHSSSDLKATEDASQHLNPSVANVIVDVDTANVSPELAEFVWNRANKDLIAEGSQEKDNAEYLGRLTEYQQLAKSALKFGLYAYNRLIDYARTEKQQYWLHRREFDEVNPAQTAIRCGAVISFRGSLDCIGRVRLNAFPNVITLRPIPLYKDGPPYALRSEDQDLVQGFLNNSARPDSILEFLANAKALLDTDMSRSAIIEAIAAVETAIARFFKPVELGQRKDLAISLHSHLEAIDDPLERIGLGRTIRYLLPLVLPPTKLPQSVIDKCYELYVLRNQAVHNAQRSFKGVNIRSLIDEAEKLCRVLIRPG